MSAILRCKAQWKHEQPAFSRMGLFSMLTKTRIWAPCPAAVLRTYKSYTRSVSLILTSFWLLTVNHVVSSISAWNQLGGVEPRDLCWYHVCRLTMSISSLTGSSNYVLCYFLLPSDAQWDTLPMHLTDFPYSTRCGEKNLHWTKSFWKHPSFSSTKTLRLCAAIWVLALGSGNRCIDGKMLDVKTRILRIVEKKVLERERDVSVVCWDSAPFGILACFSQSTLGEPHVFFAWHLLIAHSGSDVGPRSWSMIEKRYSWQMSVLMFSVCLWRVDSCWLTGITRNYIISTWAHVP